MGKTVTPVLVCRPSSYGVSDSREIFVTRFVLPPILTIFLLLPLGPAWAAQDFYVGTNRLEQLRGELFTQAGEGETCQIVSVSGLIEIEENYTRDQHTTNIDRDAFDLTLDEVRLGLDVQVNTWAGGSISFSYQEELDDPELDEATINLSYKILRSRIGRQFLPLGLQRTELVSDPLVRLLGETRATALSLGIETDLINLSGFLFRSAYDDKPDVQNRLQDWGAQLRLVVDEWLDAGAAYLNDFAEVDHGLVAHPYIKQVGGWSGWVKLNTPYLVVRSETIGAERPFDANDLDSDGNGQGDRPRAWLSELAIPFANQFSCGLRYEGSDEVYMFPEHQYGVDLTWTVLTGTTLSFEALRGEFDPLFTRNGTLKQRDKLTLQMAVTF